MRKVKFFAVLLAVCLSFGILAGCNDTSGDDIAINVGDVGVTVNELNFQLKVYKNQILNYINQSGGSYTWAGVKNETFTQDSTTGETVTVLDYVSLIAQDQATLNAQYRIVFERMGLAPLTDEVIEDTLRTDVGGEEEYEKFKETLKSSVFTLDEYLKYYATPKAMYNAIAEALKTGTDTGEVDFDALKSDAIANYVHVKHILIKDVDSSNNALEGEELEKAKAKYEEADAKVKAGGDFDALVKEYSEDNMPESGYVFNKDASYVQEFKDVSFALAVGDVGLAESSYGWHIIKRYPMDDESIGSATFEILMAKIHEEAKAEPNTDLVAKLLKKL